MADWRRALTEDEIPAAFRNVYGDRTEKPLSVKGAEIGVEFTPAGTVFGLNDIKEELQKENPDYYKIGMMAGVEAIGLIPGLDKVAVEAIRAGAKKVGLDKVADQTDALLSKPKAKDSVKTEIIAGPGAKSYGNASLLRAERLRAAGASPAQIEAETGRVRTGTPEDYLDNEGKTLADLSPEYANLVGIRDHLEGLIKQISTENSSSAASEIARYERELAEINQRITKFEKANPADESGIVVKPQNPFKFEIDDSRIEIKNSDGSQTLKESTKHYPMIVRNIIPTHTELFDEYPNLEYLEFYVDPSLGRGAHFNPTVGREGAIVVGPDGTGLGSPNNKKFRNTFFHELQHAVQYQDYKIAGLEQLGGNPTGFGIISVQPDRFYKGREQLKLLEKNPNLVKLRDEILDIFESQKGTGALDATSAGFTFPGVTPNPAKVFGDVEVAKKMARKMRELESELFKTYMRTTSETEARLAGRRAQDIATVGSGPKPKVTSDLAKERRIETLEEYSSDTPKSDVDKKKEDIKIKLGSMTNEEILRYATGGINFAKYATGIDKELQGFSVFGPTKTNYAEGGAVSNMNRQMELFAQGGLRDDGMDMDPVSGNEVPSGSLAEEVRDDIPAQLSEGEYVVPADVVRYYGVKFFEDLRADAKMGLQQMEANGRIGGEPIMDQGVTDEDLAALDQMLTTGAYNGGLMDKLEYSAKNDPMVNQRLNQGGMVVGFAEGGMTQSLYSDPTQIDAVINKVMAAARQNPEIMKQLSARGIQFSRTEPQMPPQQMNQANPPQEARQGMAVGGPVVPMPGVPGYDASEEQMYNYITSPTTINPVYTVPGASYSYAEDGALPTPKPQEPVASPEYCDSIGMMFDPTTNACVPKPQVQTSTDDGSSAPTPKPADRMANAEYLNNNLNFSDPESIEEWAKGLSEPMKGGKFLKGAGVLAGGPAALLLGGAPSIDALKDISDLRAAQIIAEARGDTKLAETLSGYVEDRLKSSNKIVDMLDDIVATGKRKADDYAKFLGFEDLEDLSKPENQERLQARTRKYTVEDLKQDEAERKRVQSMSRAQAEAAGIDTGGKSSNNDDDDPFEAFKDAATGTATVTDSTGNKRTVVTYDPKKVREKSKTTKVGGRARGGLMRKSK